MLATTALLAAGAAHAQETSPPSTIEEVVVTAQKRAERLEDVPISITAASGETLERAGITRLEDISKIAPGVQLSRTGVYVQPAVRGVTTQLVGAGQENNVAVYVDGFYLPFQRGLNLDLANISQVSVLKGPQGTLFGRNATGGALLIETLQPSMTERSGRFSLGYGRFADKRVQAYFSTPVSEVLAVNVAGYYRKSDGYIKDISGFNTAPLSNYSLNAKARFQPNDDLTLTLTGETLKVSDGRGLAVTYDGRALAQVLFPGSYVEKGRNLTSLNHPVINRSFQNSASLKGEYRLGWATLTSFTRIEKERDFSSYEIDGSARPVYDQNFHEYGRAFSQEVNLTSTKTDPLSYVLGLFYFNSRSRADDNFVRAAPSTVFLPQNDSVIDATAYAAYADATWHMADRLYLTGGLRYSHEKKGVIIWSGAGALLLQKSATFHSVTPRAVLRYELTPDSNVYASFSKGFKSGLISTTAPFNIVQPEKLTAYEVGFKTAQGAFRFDLAGYYYDYKNLQVSSISVINGVNSSIIANAATAKIYGVEAQLSARLSQQFNARAAVAYNHARYKDFRNAPVNLPSATTGLNSASCPNTAPPPATVPCTQDQSGQQIVRAPDWTFNVGGDYTVPIGFGDVVLTANVSYSSPYSPTKSDLGLNGSGYRYRQGDITLVNLQAAWRAPGDHWTLTAFGNNVTDERYYIVLTGTAFGDYHVEAEPATWGVRADYRF
ncbi:TonB-dependent receptor [Phenylobacterium sp.]|uniref:TonB-dependent receptor n=1 Tax=Phenylobacterium sp. TaxID=1871053 RepID=UPI002F42C2A7